MNIRWSNSGTTFLEIIIALAILALIAAPFMSTFVFSERTTIETGQIIDATFIAQQRLEQIHAQSFASAIDAGNRVREPFEDAFVEVTSVPYHPDNPLFFNIIIQSSGTNLIITTPTGGEVRTLSTITGPTIITASITANGYTVSVGAQSLSGTFQTSGSVLIMFNATGYTGNHAITLHVPNPGRTVNVHEFETFTNRNLVTVTGSASLHVYTGLGIRNTSVLRTRVSVFESNFATTPKAVMESIMELPN